MRNEFIESYLNSLISPINEVTSEEDSIGIVKLLGI